jgi:hypothetical protein
VPGPAAPVGDDAGDRWHVSPTRKVALSLENAEALDDEQFEIDFVRGYLHRRWQEPETRVDLGRGERQGMKLTLDEAEQVAAMLLALVEVGRKALPAH